MKRFLLISILILALFGAFDAGYLVVQSARGEAVVCPQVSVGRFNLDQCNIVLSTPYAKFLGLPTALYGLVAYLFFSILVLYEVNEKRTSGVIKLLSYFSGFGVLVSAYFVYLQFYVINALCFYCLVSTTLIVLIFIGSIIYNIKYFGHVAQSG